MQPNWDESIQIISDLISKKENYQKTLSEIAGKILSDYGSGALKDFTKEIEETTGMRISYQTLRNYGWVHNRLQGLDIPEDLSYTAKQQLAGSSNATEWLARCLKEGWSSAELVRRIKESKGIKEKKNLCPNCGWNLDVKKES